MNLDLMMVPRELSAILNVAVALLFVAVPEGILS